MKFVVLFIIFVSRLENHFRYPNLFLKWLKCGTHTVCDMGRVNRRSLQTLLGASKETPYFIFLGKEVVKIFDPPHLLKCFRNLFLKYNIKWNTNAQICIVQLKVQVSS